METWMQYISPDTPNENRRYCDMGGGGYGEGPHWVSSKTSTCGTIRREFRYYEGKLVQIETFKMPEKVKIETVMYL